MKSAGLVKSLIACLAAIMPGVACAQLPGLAIAGSTNPQALPVSAVEFINNCYAGDPIVNCQRQFASGAFDVTLADGTDIEFNAEGVLTDIEAPYGHPLSPDTISAILPPQCVEQLAADGNLERVESIGMNGLGGFELVFVPSTQHTMESWQPLPPGRAFVNPDGFLMGYETW